MVTQSLRIRARALRMLEGSHTTRASLLSVLLRTASDCMLPKIVKLCRRERNARAKFLRLLSQV